MDALELVKDMERNMEGVGTISVPYHIKQIKAAIAELENLQTELDELKGVTHGDSAIVIIENLQAEKESLKEALKKYGTHPSYCKFHAALGYKRELACTCGFEQALKGE